MPGLELPAPDSRRLGRSPLELVVCQIRHERNAAVADAKRAFAVRDGLGAKYPSDEEANGLALNITGGAGGISTATDQQQGWNFKSADGNWTVVLMPEFFALETRAYTDWNDFSARLDELVRQVEPVLKPDVERRVGLRFIDRITDPRVSSPGKGGSTRGYSDQFCTTSSERPSKASNRYSNSMVAMIWRCCSDMAASWKVCLRIRRGTTCSISTARDRVAAHSPRRP